jgi:hypothetical protein
MRCGLARISKIYRRPGRTLSVGFTQTPPSRIVRSTVAISLSLRLNLGRRMTSSYSAKIFPLTHSCMSGSRMVIRNTCAGCPCGLSRAEIRMLVSRTTRIIAPGAVDDYAVPFAQRLFPRRSLRQRAGRARPLCGFPGLLEPFRGRRRRQRTDADRFVLSN